jgi:hypothetical protein
MFFLMKDVLLIEEHVLSVTNREGGADVNRGLS